MPLAGNVAAFARLSHGAPEKPPRYPGPWGVLQALIHMFVLGSLQGWGHVMGACGRKPTWLWPFLFLGMDPTVSPQVEDPPPQLGRFRFIQEVSELKHLFWYN